MIPAISTTLPMEFNALPSCQYDWTANSSYYPTHPSGYLHLQPQTGVPLVRNNDFGSLDFNESQKTTMTGIGPVNSIGYEDMLSSNVAMAQPTMDSMEQHWLMPEIPSTSSLQSHSSGYYSGEQSSVSIGDTAGSPNNIASSQVAMLMEGQNLGGGSRINSQPDIKICQFELMSQTLSYAHHGRAARDCKHVDDAFAIIHASVCDPNIDQLLVKLTAFLGNAEGREKHETAQFASGKHKVDKDGLLQIDAQVSANTWQNSSKDYKWITLCQPIEFGKRSKNTSKYKIQSYELKCTVIYQLRVYRNGSMNQQSIIACKTFASPVVELILKGEPQLITRSGVVFSFNGQRFTRQLAFFDSAFDPKKYQVIIQQPNGDAIELEASVVNRSEKKLVQLDVPESVANEQWVVQPREQRGLSSQPIKQASRKHRGFSCGYAASAYDSIEGMEVPATHAAFRH